MRTMSAVIVSTDAVTPEGLVPLSSLNRARKTAKQQANKLQATVYTITTPDGFVVERMERHETRGNDWQGYSCNTVDG